MGMKLKCSDLERKLELEPSCPFVAQGENEEELMADLVNHAKKVHGYTDEQLNDPEMVATIKATIEEE
jgi:predicted small metal-binding protein